MSVEPAYGALLSLPVEFNEAPILIATDGVLGVFTGDKVATNGTYSGWEVCQHILVDALTGLPVDLCNIVVIGSDNDMLAAFGGDKVG